MAEIMSNKIRSKTKERHRVVDGDIPELPDNDVIEINEDITTEIKEDFTTEIKDEVVIDKMIDSLIRDDAIVEDSISRNLVSDNKIFQTESVMERSIEEPKRCLQPPTMVIQPTKAAAAIDSLYPSITQCLSITEEVHENKESIDMVAKIIMAPEAPVEDWQLPEAMPERELMRYYENVVLDDLEAMEKQFMRETNEQQLHPLMDLVVKWERSVTKMLQMKERMKVEREMCTLKGRDLWRVVEKNGVKEARCRDNALVKKTYVYDEAVYDVAGGEHLELYLRRVGDQVMEELCVSQYKCGVNKALVESYLVRVRVAAITNMTEVRQCIIVLLSFLRRPLASVSCYKTIQEWVVYLGSAIASAGNCNDRLYLLWQLLHAPAGVGEWGAALVQCNGSERDMDLAATYLAMIVASDQHREQLLAACSPGSNSGFQDDTAWTLVDSDGEDDGSLTSNWFLLKESDLTALLKQVPIKAMFKAALDIDPYQEDTSYDPGRSCHPSILLRLMAFSHRIIALIDRGLDQYDIARYKTFNKRISRLIKHTVQFLTDHLELVLGTSMLPVFQDFFPGNTRLHLLAQYESVFSTALQSLLLHGHHGNWQCLADLPWRMLSPHCKQSLFYRLIDPHLSTHTTAIDVMVTSLQSTIESNQQTEAIYLLTALTNLATECRTSITTEYKLISTITNLLFQICYVNPVTRTLFSKVGRELLSSICLQHSQALSFIVEAVKFWHPSLGQKGLFLFRELPFCLMVPTDSEFKLFYSWIVDNPPSSVCNQLARYVLTNLNWGFANSEQTVLYLPLSIHQRMADLIVVSFKKHNIDAKSGQWLLETMKLVTSLWWNQDSIQEQSFHAWCLSLAIRLRLHPTTRPLVHDPQSLQPSPCINSTEWTQALLDAQQDRCTHPVAMYMAVTTRTDTNLPELTCLKILQSLIGRHQQYRLSLELISHFLVASTSSELNYLASNDTFMGLWRQIIHADDSYYNMVKNIIAKQFPGMVLSCIGNTFCASLTIANGDPERQETMMRFFLRSVLNQSNWMTDHCLLWLLDKLLEINTALDLGAGTQEMFTTTKSFTDKQFQDASKRSGLAQIFRIGSTFITLLNQIVAGEYHWVRAYVLESQAKVEDELKLWSMFLVKILVRKKKEVRTVTSAMTSACKHLKLSLAFSPQSLTVMQAATVMANTPPDHFSMIKTASVFFPRYLGLARVWDTSLAVYGSAGHIIFQDDTCLPILQQARTAIGTAKNHVSSEMDQIRQNQDTDIGRQAQLKTLRDTLDTILLWIDEPRLHLAEFSINGLPSQYRSDLIHRLRCGVITCEELSLPRRLLLHSIRTNGGQWTSRHDLDLRFLRLAESSLRKEPVPVATRLFQRFNRQTSYEALTEPSFNLYVPPIIPVQAMQSSTHMLEFIGGFLATMYQCAAKYKANKNFLRDTDKKYLVALAHYYEANTINQALQMPCNKAQNCTGPAVINLNYQSWSVRQDLVTEVTRNRQEYNVLVDEIVNFSNLDQLVKAMVCLQNLIMSLSGQLSQCKTEDETKKVVDCGMTLFFHIGRQVNKETQTYPPHRHMVASCMESLGNVFVQYASNQAHKLLQGMLDNELLVELYGPHFNPNYDDNNTASMYSQVVSAHRGGKCPLEVIFIILNKFNMRQFMDHCPRLGSRMNMVTALCDAIGTVQVHEKRDRKIDCLHEENLITVLCENFTRCLPVVLERFLALCQDCKLEPQFWQLVLRCANNDITDHGELSLTIDEIKKEVEIVSQWLNKLRFADAATKKDGLYVRYGVHAAPITDVYRLLLDSLYYKMCRSARENIVSWHEVITAGWDLLLKVYIPWLQAFPVTDGTSDSGLCLPWRVPDKPMADTIAKMAVDQLNAFVTNIPNEESRAFLMHCVLIWIVNGILAHQKLPHIPYHDTYCASMTKLLWDNLRPSPDCIKLIVEFFSRPYNSEQSMVLMINIASKVCWSNISVIYDSAFIGLLFDMLVVMVCKTRSVFKVEAMEQLADGLMEIEWNELTVMDYRRGMEQLSANMEPRIILCNPSTIEGKVIKLLNHAVGEVSTQRMTVDAVAGTSVSAVMDKQAIYISTVVKLLSVAFSFTQTKNTKGKTTGDDSQLKLFHLRVSGLLTEMEQVINQVTESSVRHSMAMTMLAEMLVLFKNHAIAAHALDPVLGWIQESRSSALIVPFLVAIYRWPTHIPSMVRLAHELIEAYLLSELSDGGQASWTTVTACGRLSPEIEQQYLRESVRNNCILCLVQQVILAMPSITDTTSEAWQCRIAEWLDETRPYGNVLEQGAVLLLYLYLQLLLSAAARNPKPGRSYDTMVQLLLKLSQSKKSSGLLGKVGMGKKSSFSFQFRILCRSLMVFMQSQLPSNNILRTNGHQAGGITSQTMVVQSRPPGEPLPTNKTLQNLDWLKSQRQSKELSPTQKPVLELSIAYICDPSHSLLDGIAFMRLLCGQLWPQCKLLALVHCGGNNSGTN